MTSFSKLHKITRQLIFPPERPAIEFDDMMALAEPSTPDPSRQNHLLVPGQGTVVFTHKYVAEEALPLHFMLGTKQNPEIIAFSITATGVAVQINGEQILIPLDPPLPSPPDAHAYYWLSLDTCNSQHSTVRFGIGEARIETQRFCRTLSAAQYAACKRIDTIYPWAEPEATVAVQLMRLLRDPVVTTVPLGVRAGAELTMDDIAQNRYLPAAALPEAARQLYDTIAGPHFTLNTADFPDFTRAIKHSIETPGCWCYNKLAEKRKQNSADQQNRVYLRITLGQNGGESPGIPFVLEIWPPQCYSAVHDHAGANAVIRVLHGSIQVSLFPYLHPTVAGSQLPDEQIRFASHVFEEGAITWISPVLNQVHRLRNLEPIGGQPCLTIQCYQYDTDDVGHYPYFNYDKGDGELHHFEPDSDMDFQEFKSRMRAEWRALTLNPQHTT